MCDLKSSLLDRYKFSDKAQRCFEHSSLYCPAIWPIDFNVLLSPPYLWDIETFFMYAVQLPIIPSMENTSMDETAFLGFVSKIAAISAPHAVKHRQLTPMEILSVVAPLQFPLQEAQVVRYLRYHYLFSYRDNHIDLHARFNEVFGTAYIEYAALVVLLMMYLENNTSSSSLGLPLIAEKTSELIADHLTIDRSAYNEQLNHIYTGERGYLEYHYSVRPSYQFPFVRHNDSCYCPLPHLLPNCIGLSMFYRVIDELYLMEKTGHVIEKYIFDIMKSSNAYDSINQEVEYKKSHNNVGKSPDVMARSGNEILLIESKSTKPSKGMRRLDEQAMAHHVDIVASAVAQLYKRICELNYYNPFCELNSISKEYIWGIVVVFEDSYVPRENYFTSAANNLAIEIGSNDYLWLVAHIRVMSLNQLEVACLSGQNLVQHLKETLNSCFDFIRPVLGNAPVGNPMYDSFISDLTAAMHKHIDNK